MDQVSERTLFQGIEASVPDDPCNELPSLGILAHDVDEFGAPAFKLSTLRFLPVKPVQKILTFRLAGELPEGYAERVSIRGLVLTLEAFQGGMEDRGSLFRLKPCRGDGPHGAVTLPLLAI